MTVAAVAASQVASRARLPRSATLGALVFLAGAALVYWSLFRSRDGRGLFGLGPNATTGESFLEGAARSSKIISGPMPKTGLPGADSASGGGSDARLQ